MVTLGGMGIVGLDKICQMGMYGKEGSQPTKTNNLLPAREGTANGITFALGEGGALYATGIAADKGTRDNDFYLVGGPNNGGLLTLPVGQITVNAEAVPGGMTFYVVKYPGNSIVATLTNGQKATFAHAEGNSYRVMFRAANKDTKFSNAACKVMMSEGAEAKPFEPYAVGGGHNTRTHTVKQSV